MKNIYFENSEENISLLKSEVASMDMGVKDGNL